MTLDGVQFHLVDSTETAMQLMSWLSTKSKIAFDTETEGLRPETDRVRLVQVGDDLDGWVIPWDDFRGVWVDVVKRYEGEYVAHNATFDVAMLRASGGTRCVPPVHRVHDTMIQAHVLDSTRSVALKSLASLLVDDRAASAQNALQVGTWTWATVPVDYQPYWVYAALDPVLTYRLDDIQRPQVQVTAPKAYDLELAVSWVAERMERNGVMINREYTNENYDAFQRYVTDVESWCVGEYGVKPGQNASVIQVLQNCGHQFTKATASGALALDKEVLAGIDHPLASAVLTRRQVQKMASTYLKNFLELAGDDDILHPSINSLGYSEKKGQQTGHGVRTGRMSMSAPNLQNLPRRGTSTPGDVIRNCIVARPGHTLVMLDFNQIEARMLAWLCNDPGLLGAFLEGDFFVNIARQVYSDPTLDRDDPRRQPTKNAVYAKSYGAGVEKFAQTAGIPVEAAAVFLQSFDMLFPGVRTFQNYVVDTALRRREAEGDAYVRSPITNRRYLCDRGKEYVLVNYLIQGSASEVLKMKDLELSAVGLDEFMVLNVHDEVILDVPDDQVEDVSHVAEGIMNDAHLLGTVLIEATLSTRKRWGK